MTKNLKNPTESLKIPRFILVSCKIMSHISDKLTTLYISKLFTTPIKHKVPKREMNMDENSIQKTILIPSINKNICVYQYGKSDRKILLVHGWSGRGTQLFKIADSLVKHGYSTVSFDAPAHGKSSGSSTLMNEFIASALEIQKQFGPFEAAVGHSLGGMTVLNAINNSLHVKSAVVIGCGDQVQDILTDFVRNLNLDSKFSKQLCHYFEDKYNIKMNDFSASKAAKDINIPVLVIHDNNDPDVAVTAGINIHNHLKDSKLILTEGLGHRKILGNQMVIEQTVEFIQNNN